MTLDEFRAWLDERIAVLGPELERLLNARNAIERAEAELGADQVMHGFVEPQPVLRSTPGTKNRSTMRITKSGSTIKVQFNPEEWRRVLDEIPRLLLQEDRAMKSGEFIHQLYPNNRAKKDCDRVYAALNQLKSKGQVVKGENGWWQLAPLSVALKEAGHG